MRKLTDYTTKKIVNLSPPRKIHKKTSLRSKLPFEMHLILKKYNSRFNISQNNCMFSVSKVHISKAYKKYMEQCLVCFEALPFNYNLSNYYNLKVVEIVGAESFDFITCYNCRNIKLKLISVSTIIIGDSEICREMINIGHIVLRKLIINIQTIEFLLSIPSLYGITLDNVDFEGKRKYRDVIMEIIDKLNQIKHITQIKIIDKRFDQQMIRFIDLDKLVKYKFSNESYMIDCDTRSTIKNKLILTKCEEFNYTHNYKEIYNLKISSEEDISGFMHHLTFHSLIKFSISGCVICEQVLMLFMSNYRELTEIDLSFVPISPDNLLSIVRWNCQTLRTLNLNDVQVTAHFLEFAKKNLKKCKIIYNDNIKIYINN